MPSASSPLYLKGLKTNRQAYNQSTNCAPKSCGKAISGLKSPPPGYSSNYCGRFPFNI